MSTKLKKKGPDDILWPLDTSELEKLTHAADLETIYELPVSKLPSQIPLPEGFESVPDAFPEPNLFGKQTVESLRCAFPPNTRFENGQEASPITAKLPTPSQNIDAFSEIELARNLTSNFALEMLLGNQRVSKNQFQVAILLRYFYERIEQFSLHPIIVANVTSVIDKTQNLWLELLLDNQKVAVQVGNDESKHFLHEEQLVHTAEGDFTLTNYYAMALNSAYDELNTDLHKLLFSPEFESINSYELPFYNITREIANFTTGKLIYAKSNNFYTQLAERFQKAFGGDPRLEELKNETILLPVLDVVEAGGQRFAKVLSADPIISVLMEDDLTPDEQSELECYSEERRLKMHRYIDRKLGGGAPGVKIVKIGEYVRPPTPKLSITEQYAASVENALDVPKLPRLRKFKSEVEQQERIAKKIAEQAALAEQYEEVWLEDGADNELYDDEDETVGMDYFYISLQTLSEMCSCLKIYEIGENINNKLRINGERAITLNLSASALPSTEEKGTQKYITEGLSCPNIQTFCIKFQEEDPGSVLSFDFSFLDKMCNNFVRIEIMQNGKCETIVSADNMMLESCDWNNGDYILIKLEFLVTPDGTTIEDAISSCEALYNRNGCTIHISGRSYSVSNVTIDALQGKTGISEAVQGNNYCRGCSIKSNAVLPGAAVTHAVFEIQASCLEESPAEQLDTVEQELRLEPEILTSNLVQKTAPVVVDDVQYQIDQLYEDEIDLSADSRDELYGPPSRTPSKKYRFRRNEQAVDAESFRLWVQFEDGILTSAEYYMTIEAYNNTEFAYNVAILANGKPEVQTIQIPFKFVQGCYDEVSNKYRFFVMLKARQTQSPQPDAKGKVQPSGLFPQGIKLLCYAPVDFGINTLKLSAEANEAQIVIPGSFTLQVQAPARVMLSFDTFSLESEAINQPRLKSISSKPSSVALISRQQSVSQASQREQESPSKCLAFCQVVELPNDGVPEKQEKPASQNKLREPPSHSDELDILRANAALLKKQSEDLPILIEFECMDRRSVVLTVPESLELSFVFQKGDKEQMRIVVQSLDDDVQPQMSQISISNIILNRITQSLFSREFAAAADAFKRSCQHLNFTGVPSDIAKLTYTSNFKGIVDVVPDKGKKGKAEIITNPEVMSENIISQEKQISIDVKEDELMFGAIGTKAKPSEKGKQESVGFVDEICAELKDGVQRTQVEHLFKISIQ